MDGLENGTDGVLPEPGPCETAGVMLQGAKSGVPGRRRWLTAGGVSLGLHLFVLPFVLTITVAFSDGLFAPANDEWSLRREDQGNGLTGDLEDRDYTVQEIEESYPQRGKYLKTRPQYIPPSPDFPLERELAYMQQQAVKAEPQQQTEPAPSAAGASGLETDEAVIAEVAGLLKKLTAVLKTVVDENTCKAAQPEVWKTIVEIVHLAKRTESGSWPSERWKKLEKHLWDKYQIDLADVEEEITRVAEIPGGAIAVDFETARERERLSRIEKPN